MGPIEFAFLSIWIIFGVVGWIRGFFKELGITLLLFATLLVIWLLDGRLTPILEQRFSPARAAEFAVLIYGGILILGVLMAYQGQTIVFPGKDPPGIEGDLFGILIGLFNGYLVVGTLVLHESVWLPGRPRCPASDRIGDGPRQLAALQCAQLGLQE